MSQEKLEWKTRESSNYDRSAVSSHVLNGNTEDFWGPSIPGLSFAWWSVDMEDEVLVLEVKIFLRVRSKCCKDRGASLEVRVGNSDPSMNSEAGKQFR